MIKQSRVVGKLEILGKRVCAGSFCRVLGIGSGRLQKLRKAVKDNVLPVDGRFLRWQRKSASESRQLVFQFLEELYQTMAEPMPEASEPGPLRQIGFRRRRGKKPKVALKQAKLQKGDATVLRMLPPGTFTESLEISFWNGQGRRQ